MSKKLSLRLLSILLMLSLIVTLANQGLLAYSSNIVNVMASSSSENGGMDDYITCNGTLDLSTVGDGQTPQGDTQPQDASSEKVEVDAAAAAKLWSDGMIHVFHFRQLQLIGTGASLTDGDGNEETVGKGNIITDEDGNAVIYSNEAKYFLESDITLPKDAAWTLPDDFSGEFSSEERKTDDTKEETGEENTEPEQENAEQEQESPESAAKRGRLYDAESDTIYIQNVFQLLTLSSEDRGKIPVMTGDTDMETFGTGELIFPRVKPAAI